MDNDLESIDHLSIDERTGSGQLVPKATRTQDNSYPRYLVPKTTLHLEYDCFVVSQTQWLYTFILSVKK